MSIALARKYRPISFDTLIGQDLISQTLSQALDTNRLSHAYLFSGLRGSGKTSTARIFAKALLCEEGASSHPCNRCSNCKMANENRHIDIIEMDGASNRGIDDIKELIEHTKYTPSSARYKIFIIDEVHMLTPQAFNALLKTLEEPPSFVKFILATTDPLKLPATILSRTQHFRFKKISQKLIRKHLEHILNLENIEFEVEALEIIARSGSGSLRDSLTLLDQAIVYSKNFVNLSTVVGMLGIIEPSIIEKLLNSIYNKNEDEILEFIKNSRDFEAQMIIDEMTLYLKELLLLGDKKFTPIIIDRFFHAITQSKKLFDIGGDGEFILLLTLFKMMEAMNIRDIDSMIKSLEDELYSVAPLKKVENRVSKKIEKPIIEKSTINIDEVNFKKLIDKIFDKNYELGKSFEENISFKEFKNNQLIWDSRATDEDKKLLIRNWAIIKTFVQDIFGIDTQIKNNIKVKEEPEEQKSSCIAPHSTEIRATQEIEISKIEDEPMIKKILDKFEPSKVTVKRKV
ncbi:DNA polymerase III subunits gamma and tau [hydrothermal vent metagenome]|uniref:DNA-directed DNA polymerase n=1 Tax=hydrothermal vent metagenome TaxID=652676 RepID=A0A1W1ELI2_9ZZZZ